MKLISAVVVLAFTVTSIIQNPSYAQELKLAPKSHFGASIISPQSFCSSIEARFKYLDIEDHVTYPDLAGVVRHVLREKFHLRGTISEGHRDEALLLAKLLGASYVVSVFEVGGNDFFIVYSREDGHVFLHFSMEALLREYGIVDTPQHPRAHQAGSALLYVLFFFGLGAIIAGLGSNSIRIIAGDFAVAIIVIMSICAVIVRDLGRSLWESGRKLRIKKPVTEEEDEVIDISPSADGLPRPLLPSPKLRAISCQSP